MPARLKRSMSFSALVMVRTLLWGAIEVLALSRSRWQGRQRRT
jgi:hypothetical protein